MVLPSVQKEEEEKTPPSTKDKILDSVEKTKESAKEKVDETKDHLHHQAEELGLREPEKHSEPKSTIEMIQDGTQAAGDWAAENIGKVKDAAGEKVYVTKDLIQHKAEELGLRKPEKKSEQKTAIETIRDGTQTVGDWTADNFEKAKDAAEEKVFVTKDLIQHKAEEVQENIEQTKAVAEKQAEGARDGVL